jgi:putative nucleotidyltransferase with HDIG domain
MDAIDMIKRIDRAAEVPTLPTILFEVDRLMQDPDVTTRQIARLIEKDQAMTAKLLRLANSAFYSFSTPMSDIYSAMVLMGINTVRSAVMSISVVRAFKGMAEMEGLRIVDFWHHAAAVAITSRFLAAQSRGANPDEAFVGGLLHDVGKILLAQLFPEQFAAVWAFIRENGVTFVEAEHRTLPVDHCFIGARLAKRWKLPEDLSESIRLHHGKLEDTGPALLPAVVALADFVVNARGGGIGSLTPPVEKNGFPAELQSLAHSLNDWYPALQAAITEGTAIFSDLQ